MPSKHAILSASSSDRWLHCPPSARLEARVPEETSPYAEEGTMAHSLAEGKLNAWKAGNTHYKPQQKGEMDEATEFYKNYVIEIYNEEKKKDDAAMLFVEVQVDLSKWVPEGFGTSDAVVVSDKTLHVIDLKYGEGVPVSADHNPQLMLYAAGTMEAYDILYDFQDIEIHICQPRLDNISVYKTTVAELKEWLENTVKPKAAEAFAGDGEQNCGSWCRFCKVKGNCRKRAEVSLNTADEKLDKMLLTNDEIAGLLPRLDGIQKWAKDLQGYALDKALNGEHFEGYKVVEGISRRKILNENDAAKKLYRLGYQATDIFRTTIRPITELEKMVGKKAFAEAMGDTVAKPQGAPTLVPESDPRPVYEKNLSAFEDLK